MSTMIESPNYVSRAWLAMLALTRTSLMLAGVLLLAGVFALSQGDRRLLDQIQSLLTDNNDGAPSEEMITPAAAASVAKSEEVHLPRLSGKMRLVLESVSRRYRVATGALEPIFLAAETSGRDQQVDPLLIIAVMAVESRFNPFSESVMGAQGLMQVMPNFHQDKLPVGAGPHSFLDPVTNVQVGARILGDAIRRHGGIEPGLQQFAGAPDDPEQRYANKVLQEKARLEAAMLRRTPAPREA